MDDIAFWKGRMTELAMRAKSRHVATHTNFLSVSEQNEALKSLHIPFSQNQSYVFNGIHFFAEGGIYGNTWESGSRIQFWCCGQLQA